MGVQGSSWLHLCGRELSQLSSVIGTMSNESPSAGEFVAGLLRVREDAVRVRDALRADGRAAAAQRIDGHVRKLDELIARQRGKTANFATPPIGPATDSWPMN